MPAKRADPNRLFATRWVHVFEEDSAKGAVYRPEDETIPLSRRPRERIEFRRDGTASLFMPGPDDRSVEQPASWGEERGTLMIRARDGGAEWRVVGRSSARLVIQVRRVGPAR